MEVGVIRPRVHGSAPGDALFAGDAWAWVGVVVGASNSFRLFFSFKITRSPGFTRRLGDCLPF